MKVKILLGFLFSTFVFAQNDVGRPALPLKIRIAPAKPPPAGGKFFSFAEHITCNEIQTTRPKDPEKYFWRSSTSGGTHSTDDADFKSLLGGSLEKV